MKHSPFGRLPAELRLYIYEFVVVYPSTIDLKDLQHFDGLMCTCRRMGRETQQEIRTLFFTGDESAVTTSPASLR